jgi:hypothetical protein
MLLEEACVSTATPNVHLNLSSLLGAAGRHVEPRTQRIAVCGLGTVPRAPLA